MTVSLPESNAEWPNHMDHSTLRRPAAARTTSTTLRRAVIISRVRLVRRGLQPPPGTAAAVLG